MDVDPDAIRRDLASADRDAVCRAVERIPCFPMEPWARAMLEQVAATAGHPKRYEAMLKLNAYARPACAFTDALLDRDSQIRCAAYSSLAVRRRPQDLDRLIAGARDESPDVRATVVSCLSEWLIGSDVDGFPPLFQSPPRRGEDPSFDATLTHLIAAFEDVVHIEKGGETRELAAAWLSRLRAADAER